MGILLNAIKTFSRQCLNFEDKGIIDSLIFYALDELLELTGTHTNQFFYIRKRNKEVAGPALIFQEKLCTSRNTLALKPALVDYLTCLPRQTVRYIAKKHSVCPLDLRFCTKFYKGLPLHVLKDKNNLINHSAEPMMLEEEFLEVHHAKIVQMCRSRAGSSSVKYLQDLYTGVDDIVNELYIYAYAIGIKNTYRGKDDVEKLMNWVISKRMYDIAKRHTVKKHSKHDYIKNPLSCNSCDWSGDLKKPTRTRVGSSIQYECPQCGSVWTSQQLDYMLSKKRFIVKESCYTQLSNSDGSAVDDDSLEFMEDLTTNLAIDQAEDLEHVLEMVHKHPEGGFWMAKLVEELATTPDTEIKKRDTLQRQKVLCTKYIVDHRKLVRVSSEVLGQIIGTPVFPASVNINTHTEKKKRTRLGKVNSRVFNNKPAAVAGITHGGVS